MGMTRTPTRAKDIDFSVATLVSPHKILVRRDSGITKVDALAGRTLALVRSASVDKDLKDAVPTLQIVFFDDYQACFTALQGKARRQLPGRRAPAAALRRRRAARRRISP